MEEIDHIEKIYIIDKPGIYYIIKNIDTEFGFLIKCDNVTIKGNNYAISQTKNFQTAISISLNCKNITIENLSLKNFPKGGIYCNGGNSNLKFINIKINNCGYFGGYIIEKIPYKFSSGILLDGSKNKSRNVEIINCNFSEIGIYQKKYNLYTSAILAYEIDDLLIKGCTIDGCVGVELSWSLVLISLSNVLVDDLFITDIFSFKNAKGIYHYDAEINIKNLLDASIISGIHPNQFESYLINHGDFYIGGKKDINNKPIEISHIKNVIPKHIENEEVLFQEHKWREFRTMGRQVCHNSHKISKTSAVYGKWIELFCERVLKVKVKVEAAFANFYPSGETVLPLHRDTYKKWIFGLSFGETRTFEFIPDNEELNILTYTLDSGDIFIFSHDVNERYQHRMSSEPERKGRRLNITYFIEVLNPEYGYKLLLMPTEMSNIPTFKEAEELYNITLV